uniref:Uncharacterized protein n=1 Tax=Arundo donax TaxID=35708 RepID=A0A0A8XUW8_ARUDO
MHHISSFFPQKKEHATGSQITCKDNTLACITFVYRLTNTKIILKTFGHLTSVYRTRQIRIVIRPKKH